METYTFYLSGFESAEVQTKSGEKKYFVTGYISTKDLDLVDDVVTDNCLKNLAEQINSGNIKLDADHEAWRSGEEGPNIMPIGRIIEAKYDQEKGAVWVKAVLNSNSSKFKQIWGSVKDKFIDAFSIAYRPIKSVVQEINGKAVRLLEEVELLNVALTGNPANPSAKIQDVFAKSLEDIRMVEETEKKAEPLPEDQEEEKPVEEKTKDFGAEIKELQEQLAEIKNSELAEEVKALKEELGSANNEIKSLKETLDTPQFKALQEEEPEPKPEEPKNVDVNPLSMIG